MAKFIAIEGLEGAGKSTAIQIIKTYLTDKVADVVYTREPGGTFLAEKIRRILITPYKEEALCAEAELLLMYASRMQHVNTLIKPALLQGKWVVSDRFNWSSLSYQGGGRDLPFEQVKQLNDLLLGEFTPDLTIYLDIPPEIGLKRARQRNTLDRIEQEELSFFERARDIFLSLTKNTSTAFLIDASQPLDKVKKDIEGVLGNCFHK
ncbi:dTMP kinase [Facilibium subflavum]|uniref:dTMP kinase n=1 Tax=Facilibium subflavum TaxID=2219058 RepID=UPI000E65B0D3|nr:dTMP kinase [Facilibium subflavum]